MNYNSDAMASFFTKMGEKTGGNGGGRLGDFLSSHPMTNKRVEAATKRSTDFKKGTYKAP
jgi:predicted Zn-dependent protease